MAEEVTITTLDCTGREKCLTVDSATIGLDAGQDIKFINATTRPKKAIEVKFFKSMDKMLANPTPISGFCESHGDTFTVPTGNPGENTCTVAENMTDRWYQYTLKAQNYMEYDPVIIVEPLVQEQSMSDAGVAPILFAGGIGLIVGVVLAKIFWK